MNAGGVVGIGSANPVALAGLAATEAEATPDGGLDGEPATKRPFRAAGTPHGHLMKIPVVPEPALGNFETVGLASAYWGRTMHTEISTTLAMSWTSSTMPCATPQFASIAATTAAGGSSLRASSVWPRDTRSPVPT